MNAVFETLFLSHCAPYHPGLVPEYLRDNPVKAYGQYAFEQGFKLAMELAFACLDPEDLRDQE